MRRTALAVGVALLVVPAWTAAQELDVDGFVALALDESPTLGAARAEVAVAGGALTQAGLWRSPMAGASRQEMVGGPGNETMVETQLPLDLFRRPSRVASAREEVAVAARSVEDRERLVAAAVREQAGRVLEARRTIEVVRELLGVNRQMRALIEARATAGAAPRLELDVLQVEVQRTEAQEALLLGEIEAALAELRALAGQPPDATLVLSGTLEQAVRGLAPAGPVGAASAVVDGRSDVQASAARVRLADARIEEARREGWLDATVVAGYGRVNMGFPLRGFDAGGTLAPIRETFNNVRVGAMLMLPLWNRNQGRVAAAVAGRERAAHEADEARLAASVELATAAARERAARRAVEVYAAAAREQARRNLDVVREAYELGRSSLVDVLEEQRRFLDVEHAYTQALAAAYQANTAVRRATGEVR